MPQGRQKLRPAVGVWVQRSTRPAPTRHPDDPIPERTARLLPVMTTVLYILGVILIIAGVFAIIRKQLLWGIALIVVGLIVGPGLGIAGIGA